ncbi:MAG: di-heme oxidoredictase family protein [Rhizobiaceae bacterium]
MRSCKVHHLLSAIAALACAVPAVPSAAGEPWTEREVAEHVDQARYTGVLERALLDELVARGEQLFTAKFTLGDGAGRPEATLAILPTKRKRTATKRFQRIAGLDANACSSCHNDPVPGGAGDFPVNVFVSEGFTFEDLDSTDQQFSNERNTNHLMGSGLVELLAREMTAELQTQRRQAIEKARASGETVEVALTTKGVDFGRLTAHADGTVGLDGVDGVDADLVIRPFSQKGVMTSLRQFTINALNQHHGMEASERFGPRWTDEADFDGDGVTQEITAGDVSAMVAWQASRPPPLQQVPDDAGWRQAAARGDTLFDSYGCASCHMRALPLESLRFTDPGPYDTAGTLSTAEVDDAAVYDLALLDWHGGLKRNDDGAWLVPLFGDLKRHKMVDLQVSALGNELLSQRFVERDVFQTAELWGIGSTAPYGHRGDMTTLDEVIRAHGGDARQARDRYVDAADADRSALIAFLKTLVIEQ